MTYGELLDGALGILEFSDRDGREKFAVGMIDLVLSELWELNNRLRTEKGKEALGELPRCEDLGETVPYEDELVRRDMLLGLVCRLVADEEDRSLHNFYSAEYELAKREHRDRTFMTVEDFYS